MRGLADAERKLEQDRILALAEELTERQRYALRCLSKIVGRETGRDYLSAGDVAAALNNDRMKLPRMEWGRRVEGWNCAPSLRALERRGLAESCSPWKWIVGYRINADGLAVLEAMKEGGNDERSD
jgi:hypothetical protein